MKAPSGTNDEWYFLSGGGEMGELIRRFNWSGTSLGPPGQWPQSLRLTLSIILSSKFPMLLWWGDDLVQFYNDAYRESLGDNGKHPKALGQKAKDCWPETWHIIYPLINKGLTRAEATWGEDQLIPIYRNGKIEDVYWTYSYSPVFGETGNVEGVLMVCTETTKKVLSRKLLEGSEQRFRMMAESTDIFIATSDRSGDANFFNKAWLNLTGRSLDELLQFGWADLIHPDDRDEFVSNYMKANRNRTSFKGEFRILNKNGQYSWLLAKGPARFDSEGAFVGHISSCVDITTHKKTEQRLKESEQEMRSIVESAHFPIGVYVGRKMKIKLANKAMMEVMGKGYDVIGKSYFEILPELGSQEIFQKLKDVYTSGTPYHAVNQRVDIFINGKLRKHFFNYSFTPLFNTAGKVYGIVNTAADVTELNFATLKVRESERNLRETILQAPVAMCIFRGPRHVVELANKRMFELWGKEAEEVMHKSIFEGLPEAKNQGLEILLDHVYRTGNTFSAQGERLKLPRDGKLETIYLNFVYEAYREPGGEISGILAMAIDVTSQVTTHQKIEEVVDKRTKQLAEANYDLQKSNDELAQFAHIASHDLQEPLRKISIFTQLLENKIGKAMDDPSRDYLRKIRKSSSRMHKMIKDILTYSELIKEVKAFTEVDLNQVLESTIMDYELLIEQRGANVKYEKLPVIIAVPLQMSQLFGNLMGNALKFVHQERSPVISISTSEVSLTEKQKLNLDTGLEYVKIRFADNGIGFNEEYKEQIFNIFQRLHGKSEYEGTGIGLALCKKITLNHFGGMNAEGSSENGAVFNIILPLKLSEK
ncbi:PAS domain S-box protein [Marivirga sp. S37H4]|uniref:histidine kinase n=1 Tax=Marivirga aurantiaca TaxID=2802615 RepID=A0A934WVX8_9BACT|nr:PAS domain S-box protein [Marivirga aurantiaca]MBK6263910.1 PAS domain S-box protein [Marivirga aurantiaca]